MGGEEFPIAECRQTADRSCPSDASIPSRELRDNSLHTSVCRRLSRVGVEYDFRHPRGTVDILQRQFGQVVRRKRLAAGLSQEALSDAAGLHRTYVGLMERGLRMPSILVAKKVAEALGTTMGDLLTEVDQEDLGRPGRRANPK